ncbi:MAG: GntR family transcriptional regulator [Chthoniobacteraceae bacterium]
MENQMFGVRHKKYSRNQIERTLRFSMRSLRTQSLNPLGIAMFLAFVQDMRTFVLKRTIRILFVENQEMSLNKSNTLGIVSNSPRARAVRHLQEWIGDGRLLAGQRLPPEVRLAEKLKVSRTTIRLALSDLELKGLVSGDKRCRIVLEHVKPKRNFLSDTVALIMDSPAQFNRNAIHGTWHSNFIHTGAVDAIRAAGYDALTIHPDRLAGDLIQRLISERPRGVIIMREVLQDNSGRHMAKAFKEGNIPVVIYGDLGMVQGDSQAMADIDTVLSDHEAGSYAITKWLIGQGRKRILRLWRFNVSRPEERQQWVVRRDEGYERAAKEAGLQSLPSVEFYNDGSQNVPASQDRFEVQSRLLAGYLVECLHGTKTIDAIMGISDSMVPSICAALRMHGKEPNRDILVAGYDNMGDDLLERQWEPAGPVVTVDKKNLEIGRELMALLQERIEGKIFETGQRRVVVPELIIRPSALTNFRAPATIVQQIKGSE